MDLIISIIIVIVIIFVIIFLFDKEGFDLTNNPENYISKLQFYYLKDVQTNKVLLMNHDGMVYFDNICGLTHTLPYSDNNGLPLVLSKNPTQHLPLRVGMEPNIYLIASIDGSYIRGVANPPSIGYKLELINYDHQNIIGYVDNGNNSFYIKVNPNGIINVVNHPDHATKLAMIMK